MAGVAPQLPTNPDTLLVRALGVRQLAVTIFNYTVGSGIFALPATAAAQLGAAAPMAYIVCAAVMVLVVASFAEAGSRISATGGPYAYVQAAFGPFPGFLAGVLLAVSALSAVAVVATLLAGSALTLVGLPTGGIVQGIVVVAVLMGIGYFNVHGARSGVRVVEVMTVAKIVPLLLFVVAGAAFVRPENLAWAAPPDSSALLRTVGIVIFAFMGIESAVAPSGEIRSPSTTVPRAAFIALIAVCGLYFAVQMVAQGILGPALGSTRVTPLAAAAAAVAGGPGRVLMLLGATISMFGWLCGSGLVDPRLLFAFARDGFLPRYLAGVHPAYRTPHRAIAAYTIIVAMLALTGTFERLLVFSNMSALVVYAMVALAALMLRKRDVRADGEPFRAPGGPLLPVLTCAATVWIIVETASMSDVLGLVVLLAVTVIAYGLRAASTKNYRS